MRTILATTDLSSRSDRALHRAALLAKQFGADLALLHVVDGGWPDDDAGRTIREAKTALADHARRLTGIAGAEPVILVRQGDPAAAIAAAARRLGADLIVAGAPYRKTMREALAGTTVERAMRTAHCPVLTVGAFPAGPYRRVLLATDMSPAAARAGRTARALGLLDTAALSVVHAFWPYAKGLLSYIGAGTQAISKHVADEALWAGRQLTAFLKREGMDDLDFAVTLRDDAPLDAILDAAGRHEAELLVIGARGETGLMRLMTGSLAGDIVRAAACDVLAVPSRGGDAGTEAVAGDAPAALAAARSQAAALYGAASRRELPRTAAAARRVAGEAGAG